MRVLVTGGGTAGHINPALAIASYIKEKHENAEFLFIGNSGGMEEKLVPKAGYELKCISISGFQRKLTPQNIIKNIQTISKLFSSSAAAKKLIQEFKPDVCIGTGGYVCGPVVREAAKLGIPCVLHESNAFPGVTIKMLAKKVHTVMLPVESAKKHLPEGTNVKITGNPIRSEILKGDKDEARKKLGLDNRPVVLSFGGSLGARVINESIAPLLERSSRDGKYQHIHGYGLAKANSEYPNKLNLQNKNNVQVLEYLSNMQDYLSAADLIISRAGAITITEIAAMSKASVLIPSPNVAENHQFHNAMALVNLGGADIIEEKDLSPEILMQKVDAILSNPEKTKETGDNARKLYIEDCSERIYNVVMTAMKSK